MYGLHKWQNGFEWEIVFGSKLSSAIIDNCCTKKGNGSEWMHVGLVSP
jgi:hypothetical protein